MTRAAVLIGVNRTGGLPALADAVAGAKRMERWALDQGMKRERVLLHTDEDGPLDIGDVRRAIRKLVESGSIEQLVVYFAGHGVNIRYGEYWLLSDAPVDTSAAVNVEGSIVLARRSGIPHVVFISDACRTAAEGIQAQGVTGGEIFPNDPVPGPEQSVDVFFATTLGRPALEVADPNASTAAFHAVYTDALLDALGGRLPGAALPAEDGGRTVYVVRPHPLKACLAREFPQRLAALGLPARVNQTPDARITSDDDAWLARLDQAPPVAVAVARGGPSGERGIAPAPVPAPPARAALDALLADDRPAPPGARGAGPGGARRGGPARGASFGPTHFETGCGFKVAGAAVAEAVARDAAVEVLGDGRALVRASPAGPVADVLLVLGDGSAVVLPALRGFVAALAFEDGELVDVAYEPSDNTPRWQAFADHAGELRALRAVVARAARQGVFRLEGAQAAALAQRMQYAGQTDPALALYAAYAFHDLQQAGRIRDLDAALEHALGFSFFDLELLSGAFGHGGGGPHHPPWPLLAQGWALLSALGASDRSAGLPAGGLTALQRELKPSLWTHFNAAGAARLRPLFSSGSPP